MHPADCLREAFLEEGRGLLGLGSRVGGTACSVPGSSSKVPQNPHKFGVPAPGCTPPVPHREVGRAGLLDFPPVLSLGFYRRSEDVTGFCVLPKVAQLLRSTWRAPASLPLHVSLEETLERHLSRPSICACLGPRCCGEK